MQLAKPKMAGRSGGGNLLALAFIRDESFQIIATEVSEGFSMVPSNHGEGEAGQGLFGVSPDDSAKLPLPPTVAEEELQSPVGHEVMQQAQWATVPQWQPVHTTAGPEQVAWVHHPLQSQPIHAWVQQEQIVCAPSPTTQPPSVEQEPPVQLIQEEVASESFLTERDPLSEGGNSPTEFIIVEQEPEPEQQLESQCHVAAQGSCSDNATFQWKENLTKSLVQHCKLILPKPWGDKPVNMLLWNEVASKVSQQCGVTVTGDICVCKFRKLEKKYRKVMDFRALFGTNRKKWKYYNDLEEIFGNDTIRSSGAEKRKRRKRKSLSSAQSKKRHQSLASEIANMLKGPLMDGEEESTLRMDDATSAPKVKCGSEVSCNCRSQSVMMYPELKELLPIGWDYKLCEFERFDGGFTCVLRLPIQSEPNARSWKDDFQKSSLTTWRVDRTYSESGLKNVYKEDFRCHHNTRPRRDHNSHKKNTQCNAKLMIQVKRVVQRLRSKDPHLPSHPMLVRLRHKHNHPIDSTDVLCYRDVDGNVKAKFVALFKAGHTPLSVMRLHKHDLQVEHGDNYRKVLADRRYNPDTSWCYRFYEIFRKENGMPSDESILNSLEESFAAYNARAGMTCAKLVRLGEESIAAAICTPLMRRVHTNLPRCQDMVFVDSSRKVDRKKHRVFLLLADSPAGGLPLGVVATSSESEESLTTAFRLLVEILPQEGDEDGALSFFGRGSHQGPVLFLADESTSENNALHSVFQSETLLCPVHILRGMWQFLWDTKSEVLPSHRPHLFQLLRAMVYAESANDLQDKYSLVSRDPVASSYPSYIKQVQSVYDKRNTWALCCQNDVTFTGDIDNNLCETGAVVLQDKVLVRTKNFTLAQQLDFILTRMDCYYENRLTQALENRFLELNYWRFGVLSQLQIERFQVVQLSDALYLVTDPSSGNSFDLDMALGLCSCAKGMVGTPCEHQYVVAQRRNVLAVNLLSLSKEETRTVLFKINPPRSASELDDTNDSAEMTQNGMESKWDFDACDDETSNLDELPLVSSPSSSLVQDVENRLREAISCCLEKFRNNPDKFQQPLTSFTDKLERLVSQGRETPLLSALLRFGK